MKFIKIGDDFLNLDRIQYTISTEDDIEVYFSCSDYNTFTGKDKELLLKVLEAHSV